MADSAPTRETPRSEGQRGRGARGRNRGRTGTSQENGENRNADNRGGRRGGRGGNRGAPNGQLVANGGVGMSALQKKSALQSGQTEKESGEEEDEAEVCMICASPVEHHSVAPCNHRTCHVCALRMRALYKTTDCTYCRTPAPFVIFTDDATKLYEDFNDNELSTEASIGIKYESEEIRTDTRILLRYNCPDKDCDVAALSWPGLHRHVRATHQRKICDLCSRHKKVFTHEHELFTDKELRKHLKVGDDNPGAVDQSGFKGHPECSFCQQHFYGEDELFVHCREKHERCHICDRQESQPQYYLNQDTLTAHFRKDHYMCPEPSCVEQRLIVFPSEIDLKAHQLEVHGNTLSKDVRRDARTINIASLDYRAPYVEERRAGGSQREQRGRGRGRDPNTDPIPASSAQPLRRDQQAFQRQLAVQGAQASGTRAFGGQLTSAPPPARAQAPAGSSHPATMTVPRPAQMDVAAAALQNLNLSQPQVTPQDQARQLRHSSVIERASLLLQNDQASLNQFRNLISAFKSSTITAANLISAFFTLFEKASSKSVGTLIREVADLYEDKVKSDSLVAAWNDWRAINEDYPSLPSSGIANDTIPLGWANKTSSSSAQDSGVKNKRVLKIKSATAQSSRSSVTQTRSWGTSSSLASSANPFPGLPSASSSSAPDGQPAGRISTVPFGWVPPPNSNPSSAPSSRPGSTAPGKGKGKATTDFPALPPSKKPQNSIHTYANGRPVRPNAVQPSGPSSSWGNSGGDSGEPTSSSEPNEESGKGKKKQGKKVVLNLWG